jgi:hypothetical protein
MQLPLRSTFVAGAERSQDFIMARNQESTSSDPRATVGPTTFQRPSERKPTGQLNLAPGADGGQDLACVIREITRRILEDGVTVTSQGKRTLCVARNTKIRMVEQVISFHANRNLPSIGDRKILVQRWVKLRERRPPQDISSGIAKLTAGRYRKSTWIEPA